MSCRISLRRFEESLSKQFNLDERGIIFATNRDSLFNSYECANACMFARGLDNKWNM